MLDTSQRLKRAPSILAVISIVLAVASPLGALSVFQTGYWNLVDQSFVALILSGALAAGALLLQGLTDKDWRVEIPTSALLLGLLATLGALAAVQADDPMVALIGTYQSAYGPLWHLLAAVMVVVVCDLKRHPLALVLIAMSATVTMLTLSAILAYTLVTGHNVLILGGDSYALIGFLMLFFPDAPHHTAAGVGKAVRIQFWALRASAILLIVISTNLTMIVVLGVGGFLWGAIWGVSRYQSGRNPSGRNRSRNRSGLTKALQELPSWAIATTVIVLAAAPVGMIASGWTDVGGMSFQMRSIIMRIMAAAIQDSNWNAWLLGHGWGHTQAAFFQYLHWGEMTLYQQEWDFLWRDMFHSHNFVVEAVFSVGVVGLACLIAFLTAIYMAAPQHRRFAALAFICGYVIYSAVWFELSFHLPYMALALASFTQSPGEAGSDRKRGQSSRMFDARRVLMVLSVPVIISQVVLGASYADFSAQAFAMKPDKGSIEKGAFSVANLPTDPRQTDFVRAMLYRDALRHIDQQSKLHEAQGLKVLNEILQDVDQRLATSRSPQLVLVGLEIFNDILFVPQWSWATSVVEGRQNMWHKLAERSLELMPYRSDVVIPYFTHLLVTKRFKALESYAERIRSNKPDDPVAMYYLGAVQSQGNDVGSKQQGLSSIATALDCGIERFMEIPQWLVNSVQVYRNGPSGCPVKMEFGKN